MNAQVALGSLKYAKEVVELVLVDPGEGHTSERVVTVLGVDAVLLEVLGQLIDMLC